MSSQGVISHENEKDFSCKEEVKLFVDVNTLIGNSIEFIKKIKHFCYWNK